MFLVLYFISASLYPGGSNAFPEKDGFDWIYSYWCNLTEDYSINGKVNLAKPYALGGAIVLCVSLSYFFFMFPRYFELKYPWNKIMIFAGVLACVFTLLIHTKFHDLMAILASAFGSFAIIALFLGLRKRGWLHFIWTGSVCIVLVVLNGYIYFSGNYIKLLPLIQKITFAAVLLWFLALNVMLRTHRK